VKPVNILEDARTRPDLFRWNGSIAEADLARWLTVERLTLPRDLLEFWMETGGGDVLETETLLGPLAPLGSGDDVVGTSLMHRAKGMGMDLVVFHVGVGLSAVRSTDGRYLAIDERDYSVTAEFASFDDWYTTLIRAEYAGRYDFGAAAIEAGPDDEGRRR